MLITIHENGSNANSFQTIFKENMILPKMATLRLKNAFIGLNHSFIVSDTKIMTLMINDNTMTPVQLVLNAGSYTIPALANEIDTLLKGVITANNLNATASFDYTEGAKGGFGAGALQLKIACNSLNPNIFNRLSFGEADNGFNVFRL